MSMKEIEFTIDEKSGEIEMETLGTKGKECEEILDKIQKILQAALITKIEKPEKNMREVIITRTKQKIQGK